MIEKFLLQTKLVLLTFLATIASGFADAFGVIDTNITTLTSLVGIVMSVIVGLAHVRLLNAKRNTELKKAIEIIERAKVEKQEKEIELNKLQESGTELKRSSDK